MKQAVIAPCDLCDALTHGQYPMTLNCETKYFCLKLNETMCLLACRIAALHRAKVLHL